MVGVDDGFVKIQAVATMQFFFFFKRSDTNEKEKNKSCIDCDNITIERTRYRAKRKVLMIAKTTNNYYMRYDTNYANKKEKGRRFCCKMGREDIDNSSSTFVSLMRMAIVLKRLR